MTETHKWSQKYVTVLLSMSHVCSTRNGHFCEEPSKDVPFNISEGKHLCISRKFLYSNRHATCTYMMVDYLFKVWSVRTLPACCNFGQQPGCRFCCHCADGADCDSLTGECGGSGQCGKLPPDTSRVQTGWTGLACQTGNDGMAEMSDR